MRTFIFVGALLFLNTTFGQQSGKEYIFKGVGWKIFLPEGFNVIDSIDNTVRNERGKKAIENANDIKADISETITLISATKDTYNCFNSTITPFDLKKDGNWEETSQTVKDMVYITFVKKMPDAKVDSATTTEIIDGLSFNKFRVTVTINDKTLFNSFLLSKLYKGYDFGISYVYINEKTKEKIEEMLKNSKFTK
jgi:hypothetical protein